MRAFVPILGAGLASAAEGYLQGISPEADLKREEIAAKRQLLPLEVQAQQLALQKTQREATQPKIQALGQGKYAVSYPDGRLDVRDVTGKAQGSIKALGSTHAIVTDETGQRIIELPSADPLKQMQTQGWNMIRQWYPQGLTPEALKDPRVQQVIDTLIKGRSDIVVVPQVGPFKREELQRGTPAAPVPQAAPPVAPVPGGTPSAAAPVMPGPPRQPGQLAANATEAQIAAEFEQLPPDMAYRLITGFPGRPKAQQDLLMRVFEKVYGAPASEAYRARWKTPVGTVQQQPALPPGGPQPLVPNPQLQRQSEQDYRKNVHDVQRLNLEIERLNLAERHATTAAERQQIAAQRAALHEQRQLALHVQAQTKGYQEQIAAIDRSEALTNEILPLITPYTVGAVGNSRAALQTFLGQFPTIGAAQLKSLQDLVAQGAFEARQGSLAPTEQENRAFANLLTRYDPRMQQIEFLSTALAYAHARALKPSGQIRITDLHNAERQIKQARSPADFVAVLLQNRKFLQGERGRATHQMETITKNLSGTASTPTPGLPAPGTLALPPGTTLTPEDADPLEQELKE